MVEDVLLGFLRASRVGNWNLHLNAVRSMIISVTEYIIYVVFDTHRNNSIKNYERILRGGKPGHQLQSITGTHILRQRRVS